MGFFSDLKNAVTGGAATIRVECPTLKRGSPAVVRIHARAESSGSVKGVYLKIRATEHYEAHDQQGGKWDPDQLNAMAGEHVSWETTIAVAGPFEMQEGEELQWEAQVQLPDSVGASLQGHLIRHAWECQAGLDMTGNDPDSGWQEIHVQ